MSATLQGRSLALSLGRTVVLDDVDLQVSPGRRIGLVGPNGVGKTTLMRVVAGMVPVDSGSIALTPPDATVGYLPQEAERDPSETVTQFIARRTGVSAATAALDDATAELAAGALGADDRYAVALERWLALGGADLDVRVSGVWAELGLSDELKDRSMAVLSGGEAARVNLAALQLARYDVFLLDEPTNDLDLDGLAKLERWVLDLQAGLVVVSHDREFLRRTVTHVAELDEFTHGLTLYAGGWDAYLDERETAARHARERFEEYSEKRSTLAGRAQREREWASQGLSRAKNKPVDNDKNVRNWKISQTEQLAGRAARTERAIERLEVVDEPREAWQLRLSFGETARSGDVVVRLTDAVCQVGGFTLGPLSLTIGAGERVAILGANGSGKSTLLDVILGRREPDSGERWFGPGVVAGELEQRRGQLADHTSLLDAFMQSTGMSIPDARTLLAKFGIGAAEVGRPTASLSPGERTRTVLALLMATGTNCLVLDEPTNHLDLAAIEQLETALESFRGTVLLVTHDRTLLDHVRLTRRLTLDAGRITGDESVG
ncbi:MAG: ABC-F family ATP-binding cassette domain-containing protein [Ilumatobacteraceae bacterium]